MVHPYFERRRAGQEPSPTRTRSLEPILKRTLGVPLFQEQILRVAMVAAGFTGGEAEELRRAMGFKRSAERMEPVEEQLRAGHGRTGHHRRPPRTDRARHHLASPSTASPSPTPPASP